MIFVDEFFIAVAVADLKVIKQLIRITGAVKIRTQHLCCIRFAKASWTAYTGQLSGRVYRIVDKLDHSCLVDIFTSKSLFKPRIAGIEICSH